jgi:hypothetical protein
MATKAKTSWRVLPIHPVVAKQAKPKAELAVTGRLAGAGIPEVDIRRAIALMRTGRADLLARVIAGKLDVARARRLARPR